MFRQTHFGNILSGSNIKLFGLFLIISIFSFTSCDDDDDPCIVASGPIVSRTLSIAPFTAIHSLGSMDVVITQGAQQTVIAEGQSNIIDQLKTNVAAGVWDIELRDDCYRDFDLTIFITLPNIEDISVSGSGNVTVNNFDDQGDLDLKITGSGNIEMNAFDGTENLGVQITGSGNITGQANFSDLINLDIEIDGSGNYSGFPIISNDCDVRILGSGNANVSVLDNMNVSIIGSGSVLYKGTPAITTSITGSGSLVDAN